MSAGVSEIQQPRAGRERKAPVQYEAILGGPVYAGQGRRRANAKTAVDATPSKLAVERPPTAAAPPAEAAPPAAAAPPAKRKRIQPDDPAAKQIKGGAMSLAQQIAHVTPEFRALVQRCTKVREFLDAIVPCPHPREVCFAARRGMPPKRTPCNRAGCWIRTSTLTDFLLRLLETSGVPIPKGMGGAKQVARRCMVLRVLEIRDAHPVGSDVWLNLCGEGGEGEVPGFMGGEKQMSQSYLVEFMLRGPDGAPLRNMMGVKAEVQTTYKAAAICGLQIRTTNPELIAGYNAAVMRTNDKGGRRDQDGELVCAKGHATFSDPLLGPNGSAIEVGEKLAWTTAASGAPRVARAHESYSPAACSDACSDFSAAGDEDYATQPAPMSAADAREAAAALLGLVADDGGHSGGSEEDALLAAERPLDDDDETAVWRRSYVERSR